jgi:hypothetical protein
MAAPSGVLQRARPTLSTGPEGAPGVIQSDRDNLDHRRSRFLRPLTFFLSGRTIQTGTGQERTTDWVRTDT